MSAGSVLERGRGGLDRATGVARLVVAWQHPSTRRIWAVGLLEECAVGYRFRYIEQARHVEGFRPFLGFPDLERCYELEWLFPLFAERVMDPRRPDYGRYLATLDLPSEPTPMEVVARSEGRRVGDTIQLFPEPEVSEDGSTSCRFLVHGIRHVLEEEPSAEHRLDRLAVGQVLRLDDEPHNPVNPRALITTDVEGARLGWVPDLLLDYVHAVRDTGPFDVSVKHVNGPDVPPRLRVLARLDGQVPIGFRPFSGPSWETLA